MSWTHLCILILTVAGAAIAQENAPPYKFSTTVTGEPLYTFGTTVAANSGFRGDIYWLKRNTSRLPNFSKMKPLGSIYTQYLCVPLRSFDEGFPGVTKRFEWFAIDYHGRFWVSREGVYEFMLTSDDGSILYLDDRKVVDNDGVHAEAEASGAVSLKTGVHSIRVSYFQGPRFHVSLVLEVKPPGDGEFRVFHTEDFKPPADASEQELAQNPGGKK